MASISCLKAASGRQSGKCHGRCTSNVICRYTFCCYCYFWTYHGRISQLFGTRLKRSLISVFSWANCRFQRSVCFDFVMAFMWSGSPLVFHHLLACVGVYNVYSRLFRILRRQTSIKNRAVNLCVDPIQFMIHCFRFKNIFVNSERFDSRRFPIKFDSINNSIQHSLSAFTGLFICFP